MVARDGRVVLLDFGLVAPIVDGSSVGRHTDDQIVGTVSTMAPEQANASNVGAAADWYAVGCMMFQAMTGRLPFEGTVLSVIAAKQTKDPPDPRKFEPAIPEPLALLCKGLLARDPEQRLSAPAIRAAVGQGRGLRPIALAPAPTGMVVGRSSEIALLRNGLHAAEHGEQKTIVLTGESGIGKTSVVKRFLDDVAVTHPDAVVLHGRCRAGETLPFQSLDGIVDGLSHALKLLDAREVKRMAPLDVDLLLVVFPVLSRVPAFAETPKRELTISADERRSRAFSAFRALVRGLAERLPTVLVVEDVHRGDRDGLRELAALLDGVDAPRLLLVATARSDASEATWKPFLRGAGVRVELAPLDARASVDLFRRASGLDPDEEWIHAIEESGGRPLHIIELARAAQTGGPAVSYEAALASRLDELDPLCREVLGAVCVAPSPVQEAVVAAALDVERPDLRRATDALGAARLVTIEQSDGVRYLESHHDRITSLVRSEMGTPEANAILLLLDQHLVALSGPDDEARIPILRTLEERAELGRLLVLAARRAYDQLAFERASRLFAEAIELAVLTPDVEREARVVGAECLVYDGQLPEAASSFVVASALEPDGTARAELLARASHARAAALDLDAARRVGADALALLGSRLPATRLGLYVAALGLLAGALVARPLRHLLPTRSAGSAARLRARHRVYLALQFGAYLAGDQALSLFALMGLLQVGLSLGPSVERIESRGTAAVVYATFQFPRMAERATASARSDVDRVGGAKAEGKHAFFGAITASKLGRFEEMERIVESARALDGGIDGFEYLSLAGRVGWLFSARGRYEQAASWFERAFDRTPPDRENHFIALCRDQQAGIYAMLGKPSDARERIGAVVEAGDFRSMRGRMAIDYSLLFAREDEPDEAEVDRLARLHEAHFGAAPARGDEELIGYCALAYLALDRAFATPAAERTPRVAALRAARDGVAGIAGWPVHAPHLPVLDGSLAFFAGRADEALRILDQAEARALSIGHVWASLESLLVRARVHHASGQLARAARAIRDAEALLAQFPAALRRARVARVAASLGLDESEDAA